MTEEIETIIRERFPAARRPPLLRRIQLEVFRRLHRFGIHLYAQHFTVGDNGIWYEEGLRCMFCHR